MLRKRFLQAALAACLLMLLGLGGVGMAEEESAAPLKLKYGEIAAMVQKGSSEYALLELAEERVPLNMGSLNSNLSDLRKQMDDLEEGIALYKTLLQAEYAKEEPDPALIEDYLGKQQSLESTLAGLEERETQLEVALRQARRAGEELEAQKEAQLELLALQAQNLYIAYLNLDEQLKEQQQNLQFLAQLEKMEELRYAQGLITASALEQVRLQRQKAELLVSTLADQQQVILAKIKQQTGIEHDRKVELSPIGGVQVVNLDLDQAIARATGEGAEVQARQRQYDGCKEDRNFYRSRYGSGSYEYRLADIDLDEAGIRLQQARRTARIRVEAAYNNARAAAAGLDLEEQALALAEADREAAAARYEAGMISGLELARAQLDVMQAARQAYQARMDYLQARAAFDLAARGIAAPPAGP